MDYIKYMKDNPKGYRFKRKLYGRGRVPVKWQGRLFLATWMALFIRISTMVDKNSHSGSDTLTGMFIPTILLLIILFLVCYGTGEKPKWSRGK